MAGFAAEFFKNVFNVFVHGADAEAQDRGDVGVALALCDPEEDFGLAGGHAEDAEGAGGDGHDFFEVENDEVVAAGFDEAADVELARSGGELGGGRGGE